MYEFVLAASTCGADARDVSRKLTTSLTLLSLLFCPTFNPISPSPAAASKGKVARCYTGPLDSAPAKAMAKCDPRAPFVMHCVKLYAATDGQSFSAFGRIYSGVIKPGDRVKVLGEAYSPDDDEDMALATVSAVSIPRGRRRTDVSMARAGNWVMLDGIDANIAKTATIVSADSGSFGD